MLLRHITLLLLLVGFLLVGFLLVGFLLVGFLLVTHIVLVRRHGIVPPFGA
jgi:hypothetical protein